MTQYGEQNTDNFQENSLSLQVLFYSNGNFGIQINTVYYLQSITL